VKCLKEKGRNVVLTSTTGISCCHLGSEANTLHHWSGIGDGRHSLEELESIFMSDDKFSGAKQNIQKTDTLVIDEIGMASQRTFEMVERVCRLARNNNHLFGGVQVKLLYH